MANTRRFSPRLQDIITEELVTVLSGRASFEFKPLFALIHVNLRARNAASGGEEMLRLRAYEKLQNLVNRGMVKKSAGKYKGVASKLATYAKELDELKARIVLHKERVAALVANAN